MGLFLGASLVTVFELLVYIVMKLYSHMYGQRLDKRDAKTVPSGTVATSANSIYDNTVYI